MVLSKRERHIVIGSVAAVGLLVLNYALIGPYIDRRAELDSGLADARKQDDEAQQLFQRQHTLQKVWADLQKGGLKVDPSQAESQAQKAVLEWAGTADMNLSSLKPERPSQDGKFQIISFTVTGIGSTPAVSRLLWAMETAQIPVRVNDVQLNPQREGTDSLSARFSVSALCLPPDTSTPSNSSASASAEGQQ